MTESTTKERKPWQDENGRDMRMTLKEYSHEGNKAFERHTTYLKAEEQSFPSTMVAFRLDQDITLYHRGVKLKGGPNWPPYYHPINDYEGESLYVVVAEPTFVDQLINALDEDNHELIKELSRNIKLELTPCTVKKDGEPEKPVTFTDLAISAAIQDAIETGNEELAQRLTITGRYGFISALEQAAQDGDLKAVAKLQASIHPTVISNGRRKRTDGTIHEQNYLSKTKIEKALFGALPDGERIKAENYNSNRDVPVKLKNGGANYVTINYTPPIIDNGIALALAVDGLGPVVREWMHILEGLIQDNPDKTIFTDIDVLKRYGLKRPTDHEHDELRMQSMLAYMQLNSAQTLLDVTAEERANQARRDKDPKSKKRAKDLGNIRYTAPRRLLAAMVKNKDNPETGEWLGYEIELEIKPGEPTERALPLMEYSRANGQYLLPPVELFDLKGVKLTSESRMILNYIIEHAGSTQRNGGIILFETMFDYLRIENTKERRRKVKNMLEKALSQWQERGEIENWSFKTEGRKTVGVIVCGMREWLQKR